MNRCYLLGNLGADPELRFTQGGQAVLNLRLATTESYLDKDKVRKEVTDWHSIVVWGPRGEALAKFLKKGMGLMIEGSIHTSSYDDKDGNKRYKTEIKAREVCVTRGDGQGRADGGGQPVERGGGYQRPGPGRAPARGDADESGIPAAFGPGDEDIPY
jgi:single-strand DNA-binding protein